MHSGECDAVHLVSVQFVHRKVLMLRTYHQNTISKLWHAWFRLYSSFRSHHYDSAFSTFHQILIDYSIVLTPVASACLHVICDSLRSKCLSTFGQVYSLCSFLASTSVTLTRAAATIFPLVLTKSFSLLFCARSL
jgi:hypothetical protein